MEQSLSARSQLSPLKKTLLYYVVVIVPVFLVNIVPGFKSGPCTPNLDFLLPFLAFWISVILLVVNIVKLIVHGKGYLASLIIHAVIVSGCMLFLTFNI